MGCAVRAEGLSRFKPAARALNCPGCGYGVSRRVAKWGRMPTPATRLGQCTGPLAQSVEQKTFNLLVEGSNPSRPTIAIKDLGRLLGAFFFGSVIHSVKLRGQTGGLLNSAHLGKRMVSGGPNEKIYSADQGQPVAPDLGPG